MYVNRVALSPYLASCLEALPLSFQREEGGGRFPAFRSAVFLFPDLDVHQNLSGGALEIMLIIGSVLIFE